MMKSQCTKQSIVFLHTNSKQLKNKNLKNTIYNSIKNIKYLEIWLIKDIQALYIKNYKTCSEKLKKI